MLEAVIDVGSNSALLLVTEKTARGWEARLQKESICRIAKDWEPGQNLSISALIRLEASLLEFRKSIALVGARLRCVGMTEAVRKSANPEAATAVVTKIFGLEPKVLTGEEEGRLVRRAVAARYPEAKKLVVLDLGGGSLEIDNGKRVVSLPLGAVRMHEMFRERTREALVKHVKQAFREAEVKRPTYAGCSLVAVGGTATTLIAMDLGMTEYDGLRVEGQELSLDLIDRWLEKLDKLPMHLRAKIPGLTAGRSEIITSGLAVLRFAVEHLKPDTATVSDLGLRWGLLLEAVGELK